MTLRQRQPREKNPKHLDYIRSLLCCICGDNTSVEAAHIRTRNFELGKESGWGRPDDKWVVPLCGAHHRLQHTMNEMKFWEEHGNGMDPFILAMTLRAR